MSEQTTETWDDYLSRPAATYQDDPEQAREQLRFLLDRTNPGGWEVRLMAEPYREFEGEASITCDPKGSAISVASSMFVHEAVLAAALRNCASGLLDEIDALKAELGRV